jgi:hypothetical protein
MTSLSAQLQNCTATQITIIEAIYTLDCVTCECIQGNTGLELNEIRTVLQTLNTMGLIQNLEKHYGTGDVLYFDQANYTFEELQEAPVKPVSVAKKYYNEQGEEILSPADQKKLNAIILKIRKAEARLYNAQMNNNAMLASSIKSSIAFLERQEKSFY